MPVDGPLDDPDFWLLCGGVVVSSTWSNAGSLDLESQFDQDRNDE